MLAGNHRYLVATSASHIEYRSRRGVPFLLKQIIRARRALRKALYGNVLRPLFFVSRIGRRIVLGRVGTGALLDYIYEQRPSGYSRIGKAVDRALLSMPAAKATRHKLDKIRSLILQEIESNQSRSRPTRIVDLGSGAARYLHNPDRKYEGNGSHIEALCLDIDSRCLRAGRRLPQEFPIQYRKGNVDKLGHYQRLANRIGWKPNIAVVSTCYDLLDDSTTRKSLEELYQSMDAGGVAIIASQVRNPSHALIEKTKLRRNKAPEIHYREPFIIRKWMIESGYKEVSVELDKWGMYAFYIGRKTGEASSRVSETPILAKGREYRRVVKMRSNNAYPYMRGFTPLANGRAVRGNSRVVHMATNDYLGMRLHPKVIQAAILATRKYGVSTTSSRILVGNLDIHEKLQSRLASFLGFEDSLVLTTGYGTNVGVVSSLVAEGEVAFVDRLAHASILDGCKLSGGEARFFTHNSMTALERLLEANEHIYGKLIICDGVYSMDGDLAPLPELFGLAEKYDAALLIDDGHATGVYGDRGKGTLEHFSIKDRDRCVLVGSLGKGLGSTGGFVAGKREIVDYLRHTARPLLFSTAMPPASAAAALAALDILEDNRWLIEQLWLNTRRIREGLADLGYNLGTSVSPLIPVIIGDEYKVYKMVGALEESGIIVDGLGPPAVKQTQCRIRIKMMATHRADDIEYVLQQFKRVGRRFGAI